MSLQGPFVVVATQPVPELVEAMATAGAFPIVETGPAEAKDAIAATQPAAIVVAECDLICDPAFADLLTCEIVQTVPFVPVVARIEHGCLSRYRDALPVAGASANTLVARLALALRTRALHAAVLRRSAMLQSDGRIVASVPPHDPLDDATIILAGRGRSYPALSVALGERAGLIGVLSIEAAARALRARETNGIVIGDGFPSRHVEALLEVIGSDVRFRDLPVALLDPAGRQASQQLQCLVQATSVVDLVTQFLPYVRLHAFTARLQRMMASLDLKGMLDPDTGLLRADVFARDLDRALHDAAARGVALSLARFSFPFGLDRRGERDTARLVSRLIRDADFACQDDDGSILVVFAETDLRHAHVVARRIAAVLKHTMLRPHGGEPLSPTVTLATRKSSDDVASLIARVTVPALAAE